ncbi:hydroxyacid dehydrogenase [bacterium]|nr:hydroxyacid dehydrogenase [bacterium]
MSPRVVIGASTFAVRDRAPLAMLEQAGVEIVPNPYGRPLTEAETIQILAGADGLIAGQEPLNRKVLASAAPTLKALARVGIGMDNVDQAAARELGIKVSNTPDPPTAAVAELTMAAMLSLVRGLPAYNRALHAGNWIKKINAGLSGATVMLVGYGRIGRRVGEYARMFGAKLLICDPLVKPETLTNGERLVSLHEGLGLADIVSLHASGAKPILDREAFDAMRLGVILLNSARGRLIDEASLIDALKSGKVASAWLDVFWGEPYKGELLKFEQVLLSPHAATHTAQCRLGMESEAVRNLLRDLGMQ